MQRSDGHTRARRWTLRGLAALLVAATLLLPGTDPGLPEPQLRTVSAFNPVPPTNVTVTGVDRALNVSWTAAAEATVTGYVVYLDGTEVARPTTTSATLPGLVNGRAYSVTVTTRSSVWGFATEGQTASAAVPGTPRDSVPPTAPTGVTATRGDGRVTLSWTANAADYDANGYRVLRNGTPVTALLAGRATASWIDTTVVNDVTYTYAVQTHDTSGNWSVSSSPAVSATPTDLTPPAAPTGLTGGRGDGRAGLSWTANTETDLAGYRLLRDGVEIASTTSTSYLDTGLVNDRSYVYRVVAVDTHGNRSAASSPVSVTPTDLTPPAAPTGLTAVRGDGQVALSWTPNSEPDVDRYQLRRDGVTVATLTGTSYVDTGLTNDTTYRYSVAAVDGHGNVSVSSSSVFATPTDLGPPATPTGFAAQAGDGQVALTWRANGESDLAGYRVLRDGTEVATVTGTTWTDSGLTNDRSYDYSLVAVDTHGNRSGATAAVTATPTDLTPPAVPVGFGGIRSDGQLDLSWTANTEPDLAGYLLFRDGVQVASLTGTSYLVTGLPDDSRAVFWLVAVDQRGNRSTRSATVTATRDDSQPPAVPTGLLVTRHVGENVLTWDANTEPDLAGYVVLRDGVEIATVTGTTFTDTQGTGTSTYALAAVDRLGNRSAASPPGRSVGDVTPPAAPTGLVATRGDGRVTLTWTANGEPDLAGYAVLRDGVQIAMVTGTTCTATDLTNDVTYDFALVAVDDSGNRSPATAPVAATPTDLTAPAAPTGVTAVAGERQVRLSWTANSEPDLAGYRVLRDGMEIATVVGTTYTATGLADDVAHTFRVVAVDTHGNRSAVSASVSATPRNAPPAPPTGLTAVGDEGRVTLSWAASPELDVTGYRVLRDGVEIATVTGTSYVDTGVADGVSYTYALVAVDSQGSRSPQSATASAGPTDTTPPASPTGLAAVAGEDRVTLSWSANPEPDLAGYRVLRDGVEIATVTGTGYTDTGRTVGVTYTYALVAVDTHGNRSGSSAAVPATPRDMAPAPPTGVTATPGDRRAVVAWTPPADTDVVGYRVLAEDGTVVASATAPADRIAVKDLANGTTYRFTVVAVDAGGHVSAPSAQVPVTPASPPVPVLGAGESGGLAVSADGRKVVVGTRERLEASDTNTAYELYLIDRQAGTSRRLAPLPPSATGASDPTNGSAPAISADGRTVVLATTASLVPADTNTVTDVYRFDVATSAWSLVSTTPDGRVSSTTAGAVLQTGSSVYATSAPVVVSADGDLVLFYSARSDLVAGDTNGVVDLFAKRLSSGAVTRVSTTTAGGNLTGAATGPALEITPDGRYALFPATTSTGTVLLYRKTLTGTGAGELVVASTVSSRGGPVQFPVYRDAGDISISDDGRYVGLVTSSRITTTNPAATGTVGLAYRVDLMTSTALALGDGQQTVWEHQVELDPTGRYAFYATAAAAVAADTNGHTDHYRRDLAGNAVGPLVLVTADADGRPTTGPVGSVAPSEYGRLTALTGDRVVVTTSQALVSADTNRLRDLYLKDLGTGVASSPLG
ncbi:hypothetical protein DQ237_12550 [Blastococcus sp. TF02-8]|uniref:fibronectin type III domain-containing protein n=1 Tax=Blastococcus sp. TF02-8 TaxID=2250574 RepID=UPI000DE95DDC|nr:fibronectin type III domain-containing protein [Blastococcus sp. TF02-8]RBY95954.1 hypothetical protein DQ237_12550 [Blastococcus sp. TF02-8]